MIKSLLTILFLLSSLFIYSQNKKTVILDSISNKPIAFARVSIVGSNSYQLSNSLGEIFLDSLWLQSDKLSVFCYGYTKKTIHKHEAKILLSPKVVALKEITVVSKKYKYGHRSLGETDHPTPKDVKSDHGVNILTGENGELRSVWIPNEKSLKGYIEKVNVFILAMGQPTAYFRLHFYECSKLKLEPGEEITSQNIIAKGTTGNEWVSVDVSELRIPLFENGIFVGIEWFENEINTSFTDTLTFKINYVDRGKVLEKRVFKGNGCVIGLEFDTYLIHKHKNWRYRNQKWMDIYLNLESRFYKIDSTFKVPHTLIPDRLQISVPCINIEVKYIKQKNESEFEDPKKRKLNRIEKVKEDNFMYPQNSVEELFNSIIKAGENNNLIYFLKYLCVYQENEFQDLYSFAKDNEGKLTKEQQSDLVNYVTKIKSNLNENAIVHLEGNDYELQINGESIYLTHEKGKWKVNPYTRRIMKNPIFQY